MHFIEGTSMQQARFQYATRRVETIVAPPTPPSQDDAVDTDADEDSKNV